ncbi:MAG: DUF177 domain-containing protein [Cyanobacteria bacterium CRU_2_1]|nr:DUF177 domain-containing protein [Cyanobacteria bacterium RU_5_0]NJR57538.1 DUF177 domain-containing protein [Cyanobacteria bacterium CRU_2_1]
MEAIYIPQLTRAPEQTEKVEVQDYLLDLETLTPIQGYVQVTHRGNYLEVLGNAEAIVTLTCDRCLQQYNHRLAVDTSELIWLQAPADDVEEEGLEREIAYDDLVETLNPQGYFKPDEWLYEQFCLAIPQRQLCDQRCPGIPIGDSQPSKPVVDRRWASLENLKNHLSG